MGRERREFERIESLIHIRYVSQKPKIKGHSLAKDFSAGGLGLPADGRIPKGAELNLTILLYEDGQKRIPATAKVVWSRRNFEHWKSKYSSGLKFLDIKPTDKEKLMDYVKRHRWIKSDFERTLEEDKVPVLGRRGDL